MENPSSTFPVEPKMVYDKQSNMLTWYVTESGIVNIWLQHGASESYKLTDINGRIVTQGDLKDGRITFEELERGIYTIHVNTAKGTIRKEIDIQ